jgi:hypothetical protein
VIILSRVVEEFTFVGAVLDENGHIYIKSGK